MSRDASAYIVIVNNGRKLQPDGSSVWKGDRKTVRNVKEFSEECKFREHHLVLSNNDYPKGDFFHFCGLKKRDSHPSWQCFQISHDRHVKEHVVPHSTI